MFPSEMILMQINLFDMINPRERVLVAEYQKLAKEAEKLSAEGLHLQGCKGGVC